MEVQLIEPRKNLVTIHVCFKSHAVSTTDLPFLFFQQHSAAVHVGRTPNVQHVQPFKSEVRT